MENGEGGSSMMPAGVVQEDTLLFAVPKKGRIFEDAMKLLKGAGLHAKRPDRLDVAMCTELPVKLVFLPAADIPSYVMEGNIDLGISGSDMLEETAVGTFGSIEAAPVQVLEPLGFGKCKLCVQAPEALGVDDPKALISKRIVTSFPNIASRYFAGLEAEASVSDPTLAAAAVEPQSLPGAGAPTRPSWGGLDSGSTVIKVVSGSVEAACGLGLADAVVDLVETGTTMRAAGLKVVSTILETQALLFQQVPTERNGLSGKKGELIKLIEKRIKGYLTSTRFVMIVYNVLTDDLAQCCAITPGKRSPTVTELKEEGWVSVSALVNKETMNVCMDKLSDAGAKDIICFSLMNTRM